MRTPALLGAALAASTVIVLGAATPALADEPATCADAITMLNQADADHRAAVDADKAAADADSADDELDRAEDRLRDAQEDLRAAEYDLSQIDPLPAKDADNYKQIKAARDAAQEKVDDLKDDVKDLKDARDDAKDAADSDELALRDKADETDADALATALDEARDDFNRLCTGGEDDPTTPSTVTTTPATAAPAPSDEVQDSGSVRTPRGGVATGGGPR